MANVVYNDELGPFTASVDEQERIHLIMYSGTEWVHRTVSPEDLWRIGEAFMELGKWVTESATESDPKPFADREISPGLRIG